MMRKTKLYSWLGLSVSLCLSLASCQKEDFSEVTSTANQTSVDLSEAIRKGNHIEVTLDAELDENGDMMRAIRFEMAEREGYPGRQSSADDTYEQEYRPTVSLSEDNTALGILVIAKKGDINSVHRQYVKFSVVKRIRNGQEKKVLRYVGPITMPSNYNLNKGDEWYAMSILNFDLGLLNNSGQASKSVHGRVVERTDITENRTNIGISSANPAVGSEVYIRSVPFISNWRPMGVEKSGHGVVLDFDFKPQGALLQYDLGADVSDQQVIRRYGLVSNVLDFSGEYDLSNQELLKGLAASDASGWGGIPAWKADAPDMLGYDLHYKDLSQSGLSSTQVSYPWHMPVLTNSGEGLTIDGAYSSKLLARNEMSVRVVDILPTTGTNYSYQGYTSTLRFDGGGYQWIGSQMSGNIQNSRSWKDRRLLLFWGMPRTSVQNPQTYLFVDVHDERDVFDANFDYRSFSTLQDLAYEYRRTVAQLESFGDWDNARSHYEAYKPILNQYTTDSIKFYGLLSQFVDQGSERTQKSLVLHQTTAPFKAGQISHIQTVLKSDLLITEQVHLTADGHNYSMVEIHNPTKNAVSLADYALVRLVDNGSYMAYRKADGTSTDKLEEALLLPLSFVNPNKGNPFDNTGFSAFSTRGAYDNPSERYKEVLRIRSDVTVTASSGREKGNTFIVTSATDMLLSPNQTALFGASGFLQKQGGVYKYSSSLENPWLRYIRTNINNLNCRYFIAYSDAATADYQGGTLDFEAGEGFALVKSIGNGDWQVIDATAPIGPNGYGFPAKYDVYKKQFAGLRTDRAYSIQRFNGIDYPYLYPFRTEQAATTVWPERHWVFSSNLETGVSGSSLGRRDVYVNQIYSYYGVDFSLKRTPLDPSYTTYKQNIPAK